MDTLIKEIERLKNYFYGCLGVERLSRCFFTVLLLPFDRSVRHRYVALQCIAMLCKSICHHVQNF